MRRGDRAPRRAEYARTREAGGRGGSSRRDSREAWEAEEQELDAQSQPEHAPADDDDGEVPLDVATTARGTSQSVCSTTSATVAEAAIAAESPDLPGGGGSASSTQAAVGGSPVAAPAASPEGAEAWLAESPRLSIDEPLVSLEEAREPLDASARRAIEALEARESTLLELVDEMRSAAKSLRAELEDAQASSEAAHRERDNCVNERQQLCQENRMLRLQLEDHHGLMAADWAQTLDFQERLREEELSRRRLSSEVAELQETVEASVVEAAALREDASRWRVMVRPEALQEASAREVDVVLEAATPALARLQAEMHQRSKQASRQLATELEQQLCVACRDARKTVLFLPCAHVCVCEQCRLLLRPYRCPLCQEQVQSHVGRVHF